MEKVKKCSDRALKGAMFLEKEITSIQFLNDEES